MAAGSVRKRQIRSKRLRLRHRDLALLGRAVRDQGLLGGVHPGSGLGAVVAGEYGGQVLPRLALGGFSRQGEGQRIGVQLAELRRAAALDVGQHQRKGLLGGILAGNQLNGDGDLVNGARKGQGPALGRVVHAGFRGPVHGLVVDGHVVAGPAGPADCRLRHAVFPVHGDGGHGEAQLRGLALVVVRHHQCQGIAQVAELAALTADDGEQAQLRQFGKLVVQGRDADILDRFAVGEGQVKGVHIIIIFKHHGGIGRLRREFQVVRNGFCLRPGGKLLPTEGNGAEQAVIRRQNAAEIQVLPACNAEDAVVLPGQLQGRLVRALHVLPAPHRGLILPAVPADPFRVNQTELQAVLRRRRFHADAQGRAHAPFLQGQADGLIGCHRIGVLDLDQQVPLAGRGVVVDVFLAALVGGDGGRVGDPGRDPPGGAADAVDRQQGRLGNLRPLRRQRAGLGHVRLVGPKGKGAKGIGLVPVLVRGNLALGSDQARGLFSLGDLPPGFRGLRRQNLQRQDRGEHTSRQQKSDQAFDCVLHDGFPPFFTFWESLKFSRFSRDARLRIQSRVMSTPSKNASTTDAIIPPVPASSRKEPMAAVPASSRGETGVDETASVRTSKAAHRLMLTQPSRRCARLFRSRSLRFIICSMASDEV